MKIIPFLKMLGYDLTKEEDVFELLAEVYASTDTRRGRPPLRDFELWSPAMKCTVVGTGMGAQEGFASMEANVLAQARRAVLGT